jgi:nicotinamidase-related amidase
LKPALLIIDLQKAYYDEESKESMNRACNYINDIIPVFKKKAFPIIWIQNNDEDGISEPGKEGYEFIDKLKPDRKEYRVDKKYRNSFNKTNLKEIIQNEKIDTVIISGYCAEFCIQGTVIGALDNDLVPILLKNGIASGNEQNRITIENINEIISVGALKTILE